MSETMKEVVRKIKILQTRLEIAKFGNRKPLGRFDSCICMTAVHSVLSKTKPIGLSPTEHPDMDGMVEAIRTGSLQGVIETMGNVLETVTIKRYPEIAKMKQCLLDNGAENALMSGSGPTVFGIFIEKETAEKALEELNKTGLVKQGFVTTFAKETGIME